MINRYHDLMKQTFYFPQDGFRVEHDLLWFNEISIKELIDAYGTPFKLTYLPKISGQIQKAKKLFKDAIEKVNYQGNYHYCYCTKSSHFKYIMDEVLKNDIHIETSSAFDIDLIHRLFLNGQIHKNTLIVNNGFKPKQYVQKIAQLINTGFYNTIPVLDNHQELNLLEQFVTTETAGIGIRVAAEEEPNFEFYTSRLGIRHSEVLSFYKEKIANHPIFSLKMLHFFIDTGIKDSIYYWNELKKLLKLYSDLYKICPSLKAINIGGGLPIKNSLGFEYDYQYMIQEIVSLIKEVCDQDGIPHPDIFTEFGKFTIGESGAMIFSIIGDKQQNDAERWYMIDNSLMNTMPDSWGTFERFILLPINYWDREYQRINIGGITCDNSDYYNAEVHLNQVYLPKVNSTDKEPLYIGFFHTGAYQDALSGYGGIKHCLIPAPKMIIIDKDENGDFVDRVYRNEQTVDEMLSILGYNSDSNRDE